MSIHFSKRTTVLFGLFICILSCSDNPGKNKEITETNFYTQSNSNRVAAEWEPAAGTMIVWPLCIPYKLAIELAKDNHLYTLVENEDAKKEALSWYNKWGIDSTRNTFIYTPQGIDSWWVRDWGPPAVFTPDGKMKLADGKYIYSTPVTDLTCDGSLEFLYKTNDHKIIKTETDDTATLYLGKGLNMEVLDLPFVNTGGNVLTDGLGTAFSTCILLNENRFFNVSKEQFLDRNKKLLGFNRYNIISNFEKGGIQHIDCYMKLLDEERILVIEPPKDHELFPIYENIAQNELKKLRSPYGRSYEILRIKTGRYKEEELAAYTNSIIINKTIYVPVFNIKEDGMALKKWQEVMPGYTVKGFSFELSNEPFVTQKMEDHYENYGWKNGDALHCRARAVWDSKMLFMTTKKIDPLVDSKHSNIVYTTIIDYSKKGLQKEKEQLFWKLPDEKNWKTIPLNQIENTDHFFAEIPYHNRGKTIEYYVSATSNSGRTETEPRTAPKGTYQFVIQ
ncbi:MAG: agmatine deiminase family protein [Chitinophagaceae bacterium]